MIWSFIVGVVLIIGSIFGMYYWYNHADTFINNLSGVTQSCTMFEKNSDTNNCTFGQTVIYVFPYWFFIAVIGICSAIIYSSCRQVIM